MKFGAHHPNLEGTEQIITSEQHLASNLRESILSEGFEVHEPISIIIKERLEKDVDHISGIFGKGNRPWFFGGGIALELHQGNLQRDHGDCDSCVRGRCAGVCRAS